MINARAVFDEDPHVTIAQGAGASGRVTSFYPGSSLRPGFLAVFISHGEARSRLVSASRNNPGRLARCWVATNDVWRFTCPGRAPIAFVIAALTLVPIPN